MGKKIKRSVIAKEKKEQPSPFELWKHDVEKRAALITRYDARYTKKNDVLKDIYSYMRRAYGIVWEYDFYKWTQRYGCSARYLDVIFDNKQYKSIFDSILNERVEKIEKGFYVKT